MMDARTKNQLIEAINHLDAILVRHLLKEVNGLDDLHVFRTVISSVSSSDYDDTNDGDKALARDRQKQCSILSMMLNKNNLPNFGKQTVIKEVFSEGRQDLFNVIYPHVTSSVLSQWDEPWLHERWKNMMQDAERFHTKKALKESLKSVTKTKASGKPKKM